MTSPAHIPVLISHVLRLLAPKPGDCYVDATAGLGGHASELAKAVGSQGTVILNDLDAGNLAMARSAVEATGFGGTIHTLHGNFAQIPYSLETRGLFASCLLADFGFASPQVDTPARGFSFRHDGPLDMRMDNSRGTTAAELVASLPEHELSRMIEEFGEDRSARRIAKKLVQARSVAPILTTTRLAELVRGVVGPYAGGIDPATKTFQALRIAVNDEIGSIGALLAAVTADAQLVLAGRKSNWLTKGSRIGCITFHSLEDRPVKRAFAELIKAGATDLSDGIVQADDEERDRNPRARSAKLRAISL
jgi:16S rRNA (cytosine1402-N4)-methyltransferase